MKDVIVVEIVKPASKAGGDRYEDKASGFTIYIPQYISRPSGRSIIKEFTITFEAKGE